MVSLNQFAAVALFAAVCLASSIPTADALTQAALRCPAASAPSLVACRAPATSLTPLSGIGHCCSCPFGSFSTDGITCRRCTNGIVAQHGVDLTKTGTQCFCIDGYGDYDSNTFTCRRCPVNQYSSNGRCVPCASGTFAPAQSTSCGPVACPSNSYLPPGGATLADCVRCKYGAIGQTCGSVQGCSCEAGFAAFDKTTGQCQKCESNSIAVYADDTNPDETVTKCDACPIGSVASADGRTCTALSTSTSTNPYPANPIPSPVCKEDPCKTNGLSYSVTVTDPNGAPATFSFPNSFGSSYVLDTNSLTSTPFPTTVGNALITDADTNLVVALVKVENGVFYLRGIDDLSFIRGMGKTCAEFNAAYPSVAAPCISLKSSSTPVSIVSLLQDQGISLVNPGFDVLVSFECGVNVPFSTCTNQLIKLADDGTVQSTDALNNYATVVGSGTANFGSRGIAFYDSSNNIAAVLTTSDAPNSGNVYFSRSAAVFPIGQPCTTSSTIIACLPITVHLTSLTDLLNAVDPTAVTSGEYKLFSECN